jgi:cell division protein FtsB
LAIGALIRRRGGATPRSAARSDSQPASRSAPQSRSRRRSRRVPFYLRTLKADHGRLIFRLTLAILLLLLVLLQVRLWSGDGGMGYIWQLKYEIARQQQENDGLRERNAGLEAEVADLKQGAAAVEERARTELGMIRKDETFFQTVEP